MSQLHKKLGDEQVKAILRNYQEGQMTRQHAQELLGIGKRRFFVLLQQYRAIRAYLNNRTDSSDSLWITDQGEQLAYFGLREIIRRRAKKAKIETPSIHSFRRAFAINMLRAGVDIYSLQELMGHADLQVLRRYLKQTNEDIAQAHRVGSPVDNNKL